MNKIFLAFICLANFALADVEKDNYAWSCAKGLLANTTDNIPAWSASSIDAAMDALFRQVPALAEYIKKLEKDNPTNAAVVRDAAKTLTALAKIYLELPVDRSGRPHDRVDLYTPSVKVLSKVVGFLLLGVDGLENPMMLFLVNTGGDVLSQMVFEAGVDWRKQGREQLFEWHLLSNMPQAAIAGVQSTLPKNLMGYPIGELIQLMSLGNLVKAVVIFSSGGLAPEKGVARTILVLVPIDFLTSMSKSLLLTTGCKTAVNYARDFSENYPWIYNTAYGTVLVVFGTKLLMDAVVSFMGGFDYLEILRHGGHPHSPLVAH